MIIITTDKDVRLLCDTLRRFRLRASVVSSQDPISKVIDFPVGEGFINKSASVAVEEYLGEVASNTLYKYKDGFSLRYIYFRLSDGKDSPILFIGPYLSERKSDRELFELGESMGIRPSEQRSFARFYTDMPILTDESPLLVMIDTLCEQIWGTSSFAISSYDSSEDGPIPHLRGAESGGGCEDALFNIKAMEMRYKFENDLMNSVMLGQLHMERIMLESFSDEMFEKRIADPLRNAKNYSIIMNTLLRKAAEQGGVHPVHIDRISSDFAVRIESVSSLKQNGALMLEMFRTYCTLVRKHSMRDYSITVQKTVLLIDNDLSADLSLRALASAQRLSPAYLSSLFKRETGKTVSEYVREKRMRYAQNLLSTTHLQIQTVALHCGIMDMQYFSKLFKRYTGKTPKEYRLFASRAINGNKEDNN